jgi:hypothetical protein
MDTIMQEKTIKQQVINSIKIEIEKLQSAGIEYIAFKNLTIETDNHFFTCTPVYQNNWFYEERIAWNYLRETYPYGKFYSEINGNSKSFQIKK